VPIAHVAPGSSDFATAGCCGCARRAGPDGDQLHPFFASRPVAAHGPRGQKRDSAGRLHRYAAEARLQPARGVARSRPDSSAAHFDDDPVGDFCVMPVASGIEAGSELLKAAAVVLIGGLVTSTLLT